MARIEIDATQPEEQDRNSNGALGIIPETGIVGGSGGVPVAPPIAPPIAIAPEHPAFPHLNVFPAKVTIGANVYTKCLLRTENGNVEVWVETSNYPHEPEMVFSSRLVEVSQNTINARYPLAKQMAEIVTETTNVTVQKQGGCGCGSKLRSLGHKPQTDTAFEAILRSHFTNAQF